MYRNLKSAVGSAVISAVRSAVRSAVMPTLRFGSHLEDELLDAPVSLPQVLGDVTVSALLVVQLRLQRAESLLQFGDDAPAVLPGKEIRSDVTWA